MIHTLIIITTRAHPNCITWSFLVIVAHSHSCVKLIAIARLATTSSCCIPLRSGREARGLRELSQREWLGTWWNNRCLPSYDCSGIAGDAAEIKTESGRRVNLRDTYKSAAAEKSATHPLTHYTLELHEGTGDVSHKKSLLPNEKKPKHSPDTRTAISCHQPHTHTYALRHVYVLVLRGDRSIRSSAGWYKKKLWERMYE
jgi:hypothetical protein